MRLWIKRLWCHHIWLFHGVLAYFFVLVAFFLGVRAGERAQKSDPARRQIPGQENCALCGSSRRHALCLIDLATGEVGELRVYTPHPHLAGEIADEQQTGTLDFFCCAGIVTTCDTSNHICWAYLPAERNPWHRNSFAGIAGRYCPAFVPRAMFWRTCMIWMIYRCMPLRRGKAISFGITRLLYPGMKMLRN